MESGIVSKEFEGGLKVEADLHSATKNADVLIDFSGAGGTLSHLFDYGVLKKALVIGSTGFAPDELVKIRRLAEIMPVFMDTNMSLGINVMNKLAEIAASALRGFDIEIFEAHHRYKKDAPSGTALTLAKHINTGRGYESNLAMGRRCGERSDKSIGFGVIRGGDTAGEHTIYFCGDGERLEITHRASNRSIFAKGALKAAKWIYSKESGLYSMQDILFYSNLT
jgi:4-hydroxy-tetrahydrodipicolinate reductase